MVPIFNPLNDSRPLGSPIEYSIKRSWPPLDLEKALFIPEIFFHEKKSLLLMYCLSSSYFPRKDVNLSSPAQTYQKCILHPNVEISVTARVFREKRIGVSFLFEQYSFTLELLQLILDGNSEIGAQIWRNLFFIHLFEAF